MSTSDGIKSTDWEIILEYTADVVNASAAGCDDTLLLNRLFKKLEVLEQMYGRLPSILATRADFLDDEKQSISLLKEAYVSACEINDLKNQTFISNSLTEAYLEDLIDLNLAKYWLNVFADDLKLYSDDYLIESYEELEGELLQQIEDAEPSGLEP